MNNIIKPRVVHLCYYYGFRGAVQKVIDNIVMHSDNHIIVSIHNELEAIEKINFLKPDIIHLHFNSIFDKENFSKISYEHKTIQTVHGNVKSNYSDFVDKVVCIHSAAARLNPDSEIIENTVNIFDLNHKPQNDVIMTDFRFVPEKINTTVLDTISKLKIDVDIIGMSSYMEKYYSYEMAQYASKYENIKFKFWNNFIENTLVNYKFFVYIVAENNKDICYGLSLMEAVSIGMPVIALERRQDFQKYIIHGYNGFIAKNFHEIVEYSNKIINNEESYTLMCKNAQEHKKTIVNDMPEKYNALYKKL